MTSDTLNEELERFLASLTSEQTNGVEEIHTSQPLKEYNIYIEPDRITIIPQAPGERAGDTTIVESEAVPAPAVEDIEKPSLSLRESTTVAYATVCIYVSLMLASLLFQVYSIIYVPTATIYLFPKSQQFTITGSLQLGRVLSPITLSQSATTNATGKGHQDARTATGFLTLYNGTLSAQTISAGTIFTSTDGVQIVTTEEATIPALNSSTTPPTLGQVTVSARAVHTGSQGNIQADAINEPFHGVIAKNTARFSGGLDERTYPIVTRRDITTAAAPLTTAVIQSMRGAMQGLVSSGEGIQMLPCSPTTTADHQAGEEAATVTVTVSLTCEAIAYNESTLQAKVTQLLSAKATRKLGSGYNPLEGSLQVKVTGASSTPHTPSVNFTGVSTFAYAIHLEEQIKALVAGKTKQEALSILQHIPGIETTSMQWDEQTKLPKDPRNIHVVIIYQEY